MSKPVATKLVFILLLQVSAVNSCSPGKFNKMLRQKFLRSSSRRWIWSSYRKSDISIQRKPTSCLDILHRIGGVYCGCYARCLTSFHYVYWCKQCRQRKYKPSSMSSFCSLIIFINCHWVRISYDCWNQIFKRIVCLSLHIFTAFS